MCDDDADDDRDAAVDLLSFIFHLHVFALRVFLLQEPMFRPTLMMMVVVVAGFQVIMR